MGSGGVVLGSCAILTAPPGNPAGDAYGPVIPGPESKKAKISL